MVVRLDLGEEVHRLGMPAPPAFAVRVEAVHRRCGGAFDHCCVVRIRHYGVLRRRPVRFADHPEQAEILRRVVDVPARVEDLVAAVLRIGLREHHQLDIGRVAAELRVGVEQVIDFVVRQCQPEFAIGAHQRCAALLQRHADQRARRHVTEQRVGVVQRAEHRLGHAVVQLRRQQRAFGGVERGLAQQAARQFDLVQHAALDAQHAGQPAVARDVGGLGRPRRNRAETGRHQQRVGSRAGRWLGRQQRGQARQFIDARRSTAFDEEVLRRAQFAHLADRGTTVGGQTVESRIRQCGGATELEDGGH